MVVSYSSMAISYSGRVKCDLELSTVIVALSFALAVVFLPLWMTVFAHNYNIPLPIKDMLKSVLIVLIAPMILGYLTCFILLKFLREKGFMKIQPLFPAIYLLVIYEIIFTILFSKMTRILDKCIIRRKYGCCFYKYW